MFINASFAKREYILYLMFYLLIFVRVYLGCWERRSYEHFQMLLYLFYLQLLIAAVGIHQLLHKSAS